MSLHLSLFLHSSLSLLLDLTKSILYFIILLSKGLGEAINIFMMLFSHCLLLVDFDVFLIMVMMTMLFMMFLVLMNFGFLLDHCDWLHVFLFVRYPLLSLCFHLKQFTQVSDLSLCFSLLSLLICSNCNSVDICKIEDSQGCKHIH